MVLKKYLKKLLLFILFLAVSKTDWASVIIVAGAGNPVVEVLGRNGIKPKLAVSLQRALQIAAPGDGILVLENRNSLSPADHKKIAAKKLRIFLQYPSYIGNAVPDTLTVKLERVVMNTSAVHGIDSLSILSVNDHIFYTYADNRNALAYLAKVAGFDWAEYGIQDVKKYPVLFIENGILVSGVDISNWQTARFGPQQYWLQLWQYIFNYIGINKTVQWNSTAAVYPSLEKNVPVSPADYYNAVSQGASWYLDSRLLVAKEWQPLVEKYTKKNGEGVVFPSVDAAAAIGDGSNGILEGHASYINKDGSQPIRWWLRGDCQAEVAFALSAASSIVNKPFYDTIANNLLRYLYKTSNLRQGERNDPKSPSFGLIGWATTDPDAYYGDDNARVLLGSIGAAANLNTAEWNSYIVEGILGNFRTAGQLGFRGPWFRDAAMQKTNWQALSARDIVNVHPHYESWLWALYLWLYDKTDYQPLKEKAVSAISITMQQFPEWKWTNGIQQEYARMLLPLAWLVRVENTAQHRDWLKLVSLALLKDLDETGAIKERLGIKGLGRYDKIRSNDEYGTKEAPLISDYGDKVTDLLYTLNYCAFGLNEAWAATGDTTYQQALQKINEFFVRVQVKAPAHKDLNGAWFRAFDFGRWEYWASNADSGWGPWGTQTGWTQSWILNSLSYHINHTNFWDTSKTRFNTDGFRQQFHQTKNLMLK